MTNTTATPAHLHPTACYVCGATRERHNHRLDEGHAYWSNADAARDFAAEDARLSRPGYQEARYVATHRPY